MNDSETQKPGASLPEENRHRLARLRKSPQFYLRTLLIVVLLSCLASIWPAVKFYKAHKEKQRRARLAEIEARWRGYGVQPTCMDDEGNLVWAQGYRGVDDMLERLKGQTKLSVLDLKYSDVSDAGLKHLQGLPGLRALGLSHTKITDAGLKHLEPMPNLIDLDLRYTKVTDAGLEHLGAIPSLEFLALGYTQVTDDGMSNLGRLTNLRSLSLPGPRITDDGLTHLAGLKNLKYLYLSKTQATDEGIMKLQQALPNCEIIY